MPSPELVGIGRAERQQQSPMLPNSDAEDEGKGVMLLIRVVADAVIARGRRIHAAVAAQLLRRIGPMSTEDVVDTLFLSLVGCCA